MEEVYMYRVLNKIYYKLINPNGEITAGLWYLEGLQHLGSSRYH
jgi:hypothetical protein